MPPDPPGRLVLRTAGCASHTRIVHLYLMAMQFQKWPIKFIFDWPFCPSNNFPLYCTLMVLLSFHKSKAPGPDRIPTRLLKELVFEIAPILSVITVAAPRMETC